MARTPSTWRVRWEVDVEATTAIDAARLAHRLQLAPGSTATVYDAWPRDAPSRPKRIDLSSVDRNRTEPSDFVAAIVQAFPGLIDGETDVSGVDIVDFISAELRGLTHLEDFLPDSVPLSSP